MSEAPPDLTLPFQLDRPVLRGRVVRLASTVDTVLSRHAYPLPVSMQLGELLTLTAMLGDALKFEGVFSLQVRAEGPIPLMVADVTHEGRLRGYARFETDAVAEAEAAGEPMIGSGVLALTVDQADSKEPYQGIVELKESGLTDSMLGYFRNSEQIPTALALHIEQVGENGSRHWRSGGLMLQRMPEEQRATAEGPTEDWRRAMLLMGTVTAEELVDPAVTPEQLVYRLFHEEEPRVYHPHRLGFGCRCSRERVSNVLKSFSKDAIEEMREPDGSIDATCQFCSASYRFEPEDIARLEASGTPS